MEKQRKCAHTACTCIAAEGSKYCSARCEELAGQTVTKCPCGHAECAASSAAGVASPMMGD
jgi:hypothetical protein